MGRQNRGKHGTLEARSVSGVIAAATAATGAIAGSILLKKKMDEHAFRKALVRGIHDVAGSGIVRDPYEQDEPWVAKSC